MAEQSASRHQRTMMRGGIPSALCSLGPMDVNATDSFCKSAFYEGQILVHELDGTIKLEAKALNWYSTEKGWFQAT